MTQQRVFSTGRVLGWRLFLTILLALLMSGCGASLFGGNSADSNSVVWKHRDQFVRVEKQDRANAKPPLNDHPANISAQQIRDIFGALDIKFDNQDKPVSLFSSKELEILGDAISTGLAQATPTQDVTFAIVGIHRGLVSFSQDRAYVTGRVFYQGGKLNLILGKVHEAYIEADDRRTHPFQVGSRKFVPLKSWEATWKPEPETGLQLQTSNGIERYDWLVLNTDPQIWQAALAEKKEAKETAKAAFQEASQVRQESAQVSAEQERLRAELEALKQDMKAIKQAPTAAPAIVQPAQTEAGDSIKVRLRRLKDLRDEDLITEDEYRAKRQKILDNL